MEQANENVKFTQGVGETFVLFCKLSEPNPWFSNWYISAFRLEEHLFSCVEQYMMWKKACLMGDEETAFRILAADEPLKMKTLGRKVKNYDESLWAREREGVVSAGCLAKFQNDAALCRKLLATGDATIVEAADYDRVWGVGLSAKNKDILDKKKWRGENLLGKVLMRVRTELVSS